MAAPTAADAVDAIWRTCAARVSADACEVDVNLDAVVTMSKAFHCHEVAEIHERCKKAHAFVMTHAHKAVALLKLPQKLVEAIAQSTTEPEKTNEDRRIGLCRGTRVFVSSHFDNAHAAWVLLHPGQQLVNSFYSALVNHSDSSLSTETMYTVAAQHFTHTLAAQKASEWIEIYKRVTRAA